MEYFKVLLERFNRVILAHIVLVKLLNDNKDEEVEHHMGDHHDEGDVEDRG